MAQASPGHGRFGVPLESPEAHRAVRKTLPQPHDHRTVETQFADSFRLLSRRRWEDIKASGPPAPDVVAIDATDRRSTGRRGT